MEQDDEEKKICKISFLEPARQNGGGDHYPCGKGIGLSVWMGRRVDALYQAFRFHSRQPWYCRSQ